MTHPTDPVRRKMILGIATLPLPGLARAAIRTPDGTEGPFYPTVGMRLKDIDNDLVKTRDQVEQAGGEVVRIKGRVLDRNGKAVVAAQVEIWQCDVKGRYLHRSDYGWSSRDKAFQGFGIDTTNNAGEFSFRTIKPVPYSGRTPHIHLKILQGGLERLTTQLYLTDHPDNETDWLYQQIPEQKRDLVTMFFENTAQEPLAEINLVI
jgi:protocatechuate 3,4-dioxygenase beta subunit